MSNLEKMHEDAARLYEEKKLKEALAIYEQIIQYNPQDEVALSCTMDIYLELDDKFNYYLARANVNIAQNKIEYAINDTKKAIEVNVDDVNARRKLARLYKVANKNLKSIDEFSKILELSASEYDVYFELVDLYVREDAVESAVNIARNGLNIYKDDYKLSNLLAQLYFKLNDLKSALEVVKDDFIRIKILLQDEQNEEAKKILDSFDVNSLDEVGNKNYYILNAQYFYNIKDYQKSLEFVDKYVKIASPDPLSFQMKALIYEEMNNEFEAYVNWAFMKKLQGKYEEAIVEFSNAYRINQKDKTVLVELAKLYEQNKEKFVAMEFWQKVYDLDEDSQAKEILAEFYYSQGNFKKAQEYGKVQEQHGKESAEEVENYTGLIDIVMNFFKKK